jgi:hypothetical protein
MKTSRQYGALVPAAEFFAEGIHWLAHQWKPVGHVGQIYFYRRNKNLKNEK